MYDLNIYFLLFITYSFIGWFIETIDEVILNKKFLNRGFLIGPYCPIYGFGSLAFTIFLSKYLDDPIFLFVNAVFICSVLEYSTSYLMERMFKTRWWDYTENKFNINGRICLETMIPFGIGACLIVYLINPFLLNIFTSINGLLLTVIVSILVIIFILDLIISFSIINGFKKATIIAKIDSTDEITKKVREVLANRSYFTNRLIKAFPNFSSIIKNYDKRMKKIKKK